MSANHGVGSRRTRRNVLAGIAAGSIALSGCLSDDAGDARSAPLDPSIGGASMFQYDIANTGAVTDITGVASAAERWTVDVGGAVGSSPAVVGGVVYVCGGDALYALDASDGERLWSFDTRGAIYSSPAVADGIVFVGSRDGRLYAVDALEGTERWSFEANGGIDTSPTVDGGIVYAASRATAGRVYALNAEDGSKRWSFETGYRVVSAPAIADETVYVGGWDSIVYAIDAAEGTERWTTRVDGPVLSSPAVAEAVYVGSNDGRLYAFDPESGTERWRFEVGEIATTPAIADTVYVGDRGSSGGFYAVSPGDGTERWSVQTQSAVTTAATVADAVYVGLEDGSIRAFETGSGALRWRFDATDAIRAEPSVVDGAIYAGDGGGRVYALADPKGPRRDRPSRSLVSITQSIRRTYSPLPPASGSVVAQSRRNRPKRLRAASPPWRISTSPSTGRKTPREPSVDPYATLHLRLI